MRRSFFKACATLFHAGCFFTLSNSNLQRSSNNSTDLPRQHTPPQTAPDAKPEVAQASYTAPSHARVSPSIRNLSLEIESALRETQALA
jgi:hypothetical protein